MRRLAPILHWFLFAIAPVSAGTTPEPLTVHLQAIRVSDDDGRRPARITPEQVRQWIDFANRTFAPAGISFQFDPAADFSELRNTLINNLTGAHESEWPEQIRAGDEVAARHRDKLVVFFRHGRGATATGGGFSWWNYNFIAMPGFDDASHCGHPHLDALAHEIGHHLGLPHTFAGDPFKTVAEAEAAFRQSGNRPEIFDGDSFSDTPPDPAVRPLECDRTPAVTLNDVVFPLPRANIMSYYDERETLTPMQITRVRFLLQAALKGGMAMPSNREARSPLEAEALPIESRSHWETSVQAMAAFGQNHWSGGEQLFGSAQPGGNLTLLIPVEKSGSYQINLFATQAPDFGKVQVSLDGKPLGAVYDACAPVVLPSGRVTLGNVELTAGIHRLRLEMVGRNSTATDFKFGLDCIELVARSGTGGF